MQGMVSNIKFQDIAHHTLDLLNAGIAEFEDMFAVFTDKMVMLFVSVASFIKRQVLPKLMLHD